MSAPVHSLRRRAAVLLGFVGVMLTAAGCGGDPGPTVTSLPPTAPVQAAPFAIDGPGRYEGELASGGMLRRFVLYLPAAIARPAPLLIVFHGLTRGPEDAEAQSGLNDLADREGFVVAYPAGTGFPPAWRAEARPGGNPDVAFTRDLVSLVAGVLPIDGRRVFAAGMSNGGGMAARLACDASDLVAAVGSVAGAARPAGCSPERPVPVIAFHGTDDRIVPYTGFPPLLPSVEGWAAGWADRNRCAAGPRRREVADDVTLIAWEECAGDAGVLLYAVEGGGHGWPGPGAESGGWGGSTGSIDASALMWEFFSAHSMPSP